MGKKAVNRGLAVWLRLSLPVMVAACVVGCDPVTEGGGVSRFGCPLAGLLGRGCWPAAAAVGVARRAFENDRKNVRKNVRGGSVLPLVPFGLVGVG